MRSQFTTALQYLASVDEECYGVDVAAIRRTRRCALVDPTVVEGRRLDLDGRPVEARPEDYAFAEGLD